MFRRIKKEQLKVPAHIDHLGDLREFITKVGEKYDYPDRVINAFKLAIDEAATNIIRHSYRDKKGNITVRAIIKKKSLSMCIVDQGVYFDPRLVKPPDINHYIATKKKGGLGIFIIRKLMDKIDYRKTREGNELRITKSLKHPKKKSSLASITSFFITRKNNHFISTIYFLMTLIAIK